MALTSARLAALAIVAAAVALVGACEASPPEPTPSATPSPSAPPRASATPVVTRPPVTPPAPPTGSPHATASAGAGASPSPAADVWRHLVDFPSGNAIDVAAVAAVGGAFMAVGSEPAEGEEFFGRRQGVVWTSQDGTSWQRTTDAAFENATLLHVTAVGGTPFVFGVRSICDLAVDECEDLPDAGMTIWRGDGDGWTMLPQAAEMQEAFLAGVIAMDDTLVAFGDRPDPDTGDELVATVWTSTDGVAWQGATDLAGMDPISAATAGPDGMVAFGTRLLPGTDRIATVAAFSGDGRTFEPAMVPTGLDVVIESVAHGAAGFIAAGASEDLFAEDRRPTILRSADGRTWEQLAVADSLAGAGMHQVRAIPAGYLLIGFRPSPDDPGRDTAFSWISTDGESWQAEASLGGGAYRLFNGSAVGPSGVVAFALDYEEEPTEGPLSTVRAWFAPLEALTPR